MRWERLIRSYADGDIEIERLKERKPDLVRRIEVARAELARTAEPPKIDLHPAAVASYREAMESLHAVLGNENARLELGAALRELVVRVIVHPTQRANP